ncbi:MAG: porin [Gemmatimonadota bacterium]
MSPTNRIAATALGPGLGLALCAVLAAPAAAQTVHVPGIDSLQVKANVQAQFNTTSVDADGDGDAIPSSLWEVRRARIYLRAFARGWLRGDVEGDFARGRVRLTDGFVRLAPSEAFRLRAGQFKKPFDALELISSREQLLIERDGSPRGLSAPTPNGLVNALGYANRDIGVEYEGVFDALTVSAGVFNGAGANVAENDDGKQLAARVAVKLPPGWQLAGAWTGRRVSEPPDADAAAWYQAAELALTAGTYGEPGLQVLAQAFLGDNFDPDEGGAGESSGAEARFTALQALIGYHVATFHTPWMIGWEPVARVGWADPSNETEDDAALVWTAGVNLYHDTYVKTQVQLDGVSPSEGDSEFAFRIQAGFGF